MGAVDTTYTFTATDTITSAKMNNIIDQTTITTDAIIGTTLDVASGKLKIRSSGITSNEMGNNSVVTAAITDSSVTTEKIADSTSTTTGVTTAKIANSAITTGKLADDAVTTVKVLDANITPAKLSQPLTLATAKASTSGTSIDFTSIPSWIKRITVMFSAVSTSGSSNLLVQIGDSDGVENTGYTSFAGDYNGNTAQNTTGFILNRINSASSIFNGFIVLNLVTGNTFVSSGVFSYESAGAYVASSAGSKTLSAQLDRVRITTVNGTDTFDAGSINIMYE